MDLKHVLSELRQEYARLDRAIAELERVSGEPHGRYVPRIHVKRRGRPPGKRAKRLKTRVQPES